MNIFFLTVLFSSNLFFCCAKEVSQAPLEQENEIYADPDLQTWVGVPTREPLLSTASVFLLHTMNRPEGGLESKRIASLAVNFIPTKELQHFLNFMMAETNQSLFLENCSISQLVELLRAADFFNLDHAHENYQLLETQVLAKLFEMSFKDFKYVVSSLDQLIIKAALKEQQLALISYWRVSSRSIEDFFGEEKIALLHKKKLLDFEITIADLLATSSTAQLLLPFYKDGELIVDLSHRNITSLVGIDTIPGAEHVEILLLNHNKISSEITCDMFVNFKKLKKLFLNANAIRVIQFDIFSKIPTLQCVKVRNNPLYQNSSLPGIKIRVGGIAAPFFTVVPETVQLLNTLKNMIEDVGKLSDSNEIIALEGTSVSVDAVSNLLKYVTRYFNHMLFLKSLSDKDLVELLCVADYFNVDSEHSSYAPLNQLVADKLYYLPLQQFSMAVQALDISLLKKTLKKMQLALVFKFENKDRSLERFLGAEKTEFLKINGLWKFEITMVDLVATTKDTQGYFRNRNKTILDVSNRCLTSLQGLDQFFETLKIRTLFLSGNNLKTLSPKSFQQFMYLETLQLGYNKITKIETNSFAGLDHLISLDLSHNRIVSMPPGLFRGLSKLKYLFLNYNYLTEISAEHLRGLKEARSLDLSFNRIEAFSGLEELPHLWDFNFEGNEAKGPSLYAVRERSKKRTYEEKMKLRQVVPLTSSYHWNPIF